MSDNPFAPDPEGLPPLLDQVLQATTSPAVEEEEATLVIRPPVAAPAAMPPSGEADAGAAAPEATGDGAEAAAAEAIPEPVPTAPPPPPAVMPAAIRPAAPAPRDRLRRDPGRFSLDQAALIAAPDQDVMNLRYRSLPRLAHPQGEVTAWRPDRRELVVTGFGLVGMGGALPRHYTAAVAAELRKRSNAMHGFLDLLSSRFTGLYVQAGSKYRPTRNPLAAEKALAAAIGMGTAHVDGRLGIARETLFYHAGNLSSRSRSAERLRAMLEEETGGRVEIEEFAGAWVRLPPTEQSRMGGGGKGRGADGQHGRLGMGATAGAQIFDSQARITIRLGPLSRADFLAVLPGTPRHARIAALARLFLGVDTGFALNPVLAAAEVPAMQLGAGARMGWSSWTTAPQPRRQDAREALFEGVAA